MSLKEKVYIGIDVSKAVLDVYILPGKKYMQFKNEPKDIEKLVKKISLFPEALIVMESTGGYEKLLAYTCSELDLKVCIVNPRQVRDFAKATGKLAKTDKIDAMLIALFASKIEPLPNVRYNKEHIQLSENSTRRKQLIDMITMEKNRLDKASAEQKKSINRILKALEKEVNAINNSQHTLIDSSLDFSEKKKILISVKGIGNITATNLISELPELGTIGAKQISALAGLAPFNRDSGTLKGKRTIWGGRASVRNALYMSTLVAIKHNSKIKEFYERLCLAGKTKMTAIIACMHKLLIILNAMIKNNQPWQYEVIS
jgi:transposase